MARRAAALYGGYAQTEHPYPRVVGLQPLFAALVGGFAGALVTGGLSAWHEHRRDRRLLRAAARLVAAELRTTESRLHVIAASGTWRELRRRSLAHEEWDEHRAAFAGQLRREKWAELDAAYRLVLSVNAACETDLEPDRLTEVDRELVESAAEAANSAAALLEAGSVAGAAWPGRTAGRRDGIIVRHL